MSEPEKPFPPEVWVVVDNMGPDFVAPYREAAMEYAAEASGIEEAAASRPFRVARYVLAPLPESGLTGETPRTDAVDGHAGDTVDLPILCRQLERELAREKMKVKILAEPDICDPVSAKGARDPEPSAWISEAGLEMLKDSRGAPEAKVVSAPYAIYTVPLYAAPRSTTGSIPAGYRLLKDTIFADRSYPEHLSHENGNYHCTCCECGRTFQGHKRTVICKVCVATPVSAIGERKP